MIKSPPVGKNAGRKGVLTHGRFARIKYKIIFIVYTIRQKTETGMTARHAGIASRV